jgi:lambda family phage portal protein
MGFFSFLRGSTAAPTVRQEPAISRRGRRSYAGAQMTARYADFTASYLSADAELETALPKLRARARNLERNNAHAKRFLQLMQDNVVGHMGFALKMNVKATQDPTKTDDYVNAAIRGAFKKWSRTVTADGLMSMVEASRMAVRTFARDGEVLAIFRENAKFPLGLAIRFLEADHLDETLNQTFPGTRNRIRMGVEIDEDERPVAFHILTSHPGETVWSTGNRRYIRVPASEVLHIYLKNRAGQTRGEPPMAVVMTDAKMLAGYREAEITNRRVAASKMGFFERDAESGPVSGVADAEGEDGQLIMEVEPGKASVLPPGYRFNSFDPNSSSTDYAGFEKQIIRSIAAGLGPNYFDLAMDLDDVSYSSIRQGALSDRDFYRGVQRFFIDRFVTQVFARFLRHFLDFGDSGLPGYRFDRFLEGAEFQGRGWSWVDPEKEVRAAIQAREGRLDSLHHQAAERGVDWRDVADEIAMEEDYLAEKKIPVITKNNPQPQNDVAKQPSDT